MSTEHPMAEPSPVHFYRQVTSCIRCDKPLRDAMPTTRRLGVPQPNGGVMFTSRGNYGSTQWDPGGTDDSSYLIANVCDPCLVLLRAAGQILIATPPPPVVRQPDIRLWTVEGTVSDG